MVKNAASLREESIHLQANIIREYCGFRSPEPSHDTKRLALAGLGATCPVMMILVPPFTVVVMEVYRDLERRFYPMVIMCFRPSHIPYVG